MLIAILDITTTDADRPAVLDQLTREGDEIRSMPGCVDFRVLTAPGDPTGTTVLHEWEDEASFAAYLASDAFTRSGAVLRPLFSADAVSRRFRAELMETVG